MSNPTSVPARASGQPAIQMVAVESLKTHPDQELLFFAKPEVVQALADDIEANGLQNPIRILPNLTIVAGHKRVAAHRLLGRKEIAAVIDHELARKGRLAVREQLINDNLVRNHLSSLEKARCLVALLGEMYELQQEANKRCFSTELKDQIAERLGMTRRTVDRLLQLLRLPKAVQMAVERGLISEKLARDVESRRPDVQSRVSKFAERALASLEADGAGKVRKDLGRRIKGLLNETTPTRLQTWMGDELFRQIARAVDEDNRFPGRFAFYLQEHPEHLKLAKRMRKKLAAAIKEMETESTEATGT